MNRTLIMRRIVLPQAMRIIIPPTGNETIGMLKTTSLVTAVPFTLELQFATNAIANRIYKPIPLLIVACFWYLLITSILMVCQSRLEAHFGKASMPDRWAPRASRRHCRVRPTVSRRMTWTSSTRLHLSD